MNMPNFVIKTMCHGHEKGRAEEGVKARHWNALAKRAVVVAELEQRLRVDLEATNVVERETEEAHGRHRVQVGFRASMNNVVRNKGARVYTEPV